MFSFILTLAVIAIWIYQLVISSRLRSNREQQEDAMGALVRRVKALEKAAEPAAAIAAAPAASIQPQQPLEPEPTPAPAGVYASRLDQLIGEGLSQPSPEETSAPGPVPAPAPSQAWEAILGGSWLNKIGVLLLVIGLVLFIRYSFGMMGPAGRVAVSVAVSASMLMAGAVLERREKYRVPARGLLGGGWAALYATTFAAHGIEAARVIENPTLATLLLAAVALGMVLHSLRYRSQTVTGIAYFVAFVTLAITELNVFAVVALVPLAASLLYLAYRFRWTGMALAGLPATYGIYMLHAARSSGGSLALGQTVLFVYWLVFEGFDLLDSARRRTSADNASGVFPLNVVFFAAVSAIQWQTASEHTLYQFFVLAAAAYLLSALVRLSIRPPSDFPAESSALDRATRGGYEGSVTLAATFTAVAIALKLSGLNLAVALMAEAELLFLAGLAFRQRLLRHLATALFVIANAPLLTVSPDKYVTIAGAQWHSWSPVALLEAAVFYLNRFVANRGAFYSSAAAGLLLVTLGLELRLEFVGLGWLFLGMALYEVGLAKRLKDFAIQSYCAGGAGLLMLLCKNVIDTTRHTGWPGWMPQICGSVVLYALAIRVSYPSRDREEAVSTVVNLTSLMGTVLLATFLFNTLPDSLTVVGWAALGLILLVLGARLGHIGLRMQSYALAVVTFGWTWAVNFGLDGDYAGVPAKILITSAVVASLFAAELLSPRPSDGAVEPNEFRRAEAHARFLFSWLAAALLALLLEHEVTGRLLTVAWGIQGLGLLFAGFPLRERPMRFAGLFLLLVCVLKLFLLDLRNLDMPFRVLSFVVLGVILIGVSFFYSRYRERISRYM
jgi:uncharacterized membrane protein